MTNIKINCLKWGTKYDSDYVNRTYGGLLKHCQIPFHFVCYTDDSKGISSKIEIKDIQELRPYDTKRVFTYEKLFLIDNDEYDKNFWIDLDVLVHEDVTELILRKHHNNCSLGRNDDELYGLMVIENNPKSTLESFDYTVCAAALDTNLEFLHHADFFNHIKEKKLVRSQQSDRWIITNVRRLRKFLKKGYSIDKENLIQYLDDQEATFEYRKKTWQERDPLENDLINAKKNFTDVWFKKHLFYTIKPLLLRTSSSPRILEIGSFEGYSACWFLEMIPNATVECVDPFNAEYALRGELHEDYEERFDENTKEYDGRIKKIKSLSTDFFRKTQEVNCYDIIYIDGDHYGDQVLEDAVNAYPLLKKDGILIFDDYLCSPDKPPSERPQVAIDSFLACYEKHLEIILKDGICVVKKIQ